MDISVLTSYYILLTNVMLKIYKGAKELAHILVISIVR